MGNQTYPNEVLELAEHLQSVYADAMNLPAFASNFKNLTPQQQEAWYKVAKDVIGKVVPVITPSPRKVIYPTY